MSGPRIALLGFLPWVDLARERIVHENPSAIAAELCARQLVEEGREALFVPIAVSGEGITQAMEAVRACQAEIVVALGQTKADARVEQQGLVPGDSAPATADEATPWLLAPDAAELAALLNTLSDPAAETEPFRLSDDAGGYFCDNLCVELSRESRRRLLRARFLHVPPTDGSSPEVREARIRQYVRQARATVDWLAGLPG